MSPSAFIVPLLGGALIGLSASAMLYLYGRIAGISGITAGLVRPVRGDIEWRALFVLGLVAAGLVGLVVSPGSFAIGVERSAAAVISAGLLVGFGTRLGSGCTSGHGVCGITRLSKRSLAATMTFMVTGALAVAMVSLVFGGRV
ncbi:MAG: YeeE/YedE family protein [Polyangiaceae bacterium]|nr:YeeE/YedE family protein [Polyangiaceae bacterium]